MGKDENNEFLEFGNRLRELRKLRDLSQIDLEVLSGISNADISRIENGLQNIELITIFKLAKSLEVKTMELFNYAGKVSK